MKEQLIYLTFLYFLSAEGRNSAINPLKNPKICGRPECSVQNAKFRYEQNRLYRYDYKLHVKTEFLGSGQNTSDMFVSGYVEIHFPERCQGILKMNSIELKDRIAIERRESLEDDVEYYEQEDIEPHSNSEQMAAALEQFDLIFAYHDGVISEICPNEKEPVWVVNLKKGILSSFQNTMVRFDMDYNTTEIDVSGTCKVVYTLIGTEGTSLIIQKKKEISSCKNRYKTNSILQTSPYEFRENYAAWPFLQSTSYCNVSIDRSIYNSITCFERHLLIPFSNENKGAVTESLISLKLIEEDSFDPSDDDEDNFIKKRTTLLFDHTPSARTPHGEIKSSRELLNQMCELGFPDIKRGFTEVFTEFISTAKLLSYPALQQLLNRASSICGSGKDHLLESLPYIGSTASVQLMKEEIVNKRVCTDVASSWMTSLSFITRPNLEMLEQMYGLAVYGKENDIDNFILGASAVVHTFCIQNSNCIAYPQVSIMIDLFESDIYEQMNNVKSRKSMKYVILLFKAFGNIGVVTERFAGTLKGIIEDDKYPIEIRIEAINTHRRLNCEANKEYFLNIYQDVMYESEIRIKSYLQSMNCPDYQSIRQIIGILEREPVNQVGSFVWSHLHNIANSASPSKIYTQGLLVGANIPNKFKMDIRKFSRNFEKSLFFEEFNFGGSAEANLIFGTESYLPREISFNITADLFGESVNFLEISSRYQGFEQIVESYFGPKGPINAQKFMKKINEYSGFVKNFLYGDASYGLQNLREFSDLQNPSEILEMASEIRDDITQFGHSLLAEGDYDDNTKQDSHEQLNRRNNTEVEGLRRNVDNLDFKLRYKYSEPRATVSIKIFGNELQYSAVNGLQELMMAISWLNPNSITRLLTEREIAYTKSGVLLDSNYAVPLSTGLPLTLELMGVTSVDARLSGLWNNPGFKKTQSLDVEAKIKPSLSLDFQTSMKTDFFYAESGIRIKTNMHSSSAVESKLKIRGTRLVSVQFRLPQNRNEIFSAKSELLVLLNDQLIPQTGIPKRFTNSTCTWPFIDQAVGLKICSNYELPDVSNSSYYPSLILSGPAVIDIHLDKADPTAKMFLFEYRSDITSFGSIKSFIFETPDSAIVRKFLANATSEHNIINVSMSFEHGSQKHLALGSYKDTENDKQLEFALHLNGERNLALEMGLNRTDIRNGAVFYPKFFLIVNEERVAGLTGFVKKTEKNDKTHYDIDLTFETKKLQSKILGFFSKTEASFSTNLNLNYRFSDTRLEQINIQGELADRSQKGRTELLGHFRHESTAYPRYNFLSKMKLRSGLAHYEAHFDINNAPDFEDPSYNLGLQFSFTKAEDFMSQKKTKAIIEIVRPRSHLNLKLLIKHEQVYKNGEENNVVVMFRFAPKKEASVIISVYHPQGVYYTVDTTANVTIPGFTPCTIALKITETRPKDFQINFKGIWFSNHEIRINGFYQDRSSFVKSFHHLKLMAFSPSFQDTMIDARYAHDENDFKVDGQLQYGPSGYGVILKKSRQYGNNMHTYAELKWKDQMYFISTNLLLDQSKQLMVEIHLDRDRDIHLVIRGMSTEIKKIIGIEIKWNANRDPSHKLAMSGEFNVPQAKIYNGIFYVTYPNRTFSGLFDLDLSTQDYRGNSRISWSPHDVLILKFNFGSDLLRTKDLWLNLNLETPFVGWTNNLIKSKFHYSDTKLLFNTALLWAENQNLGLDFFGNYKLTDKVVYCEMNGGINSTLKDVPAINIFFKHNQNASQLNTEFTLKKNNFAEPFQTYSIKSAWKLDNDTNYQNITGLVALKSPYKGYNNGGLAAKFSLNENRNLIGAVDFELEARKYTMLVDGHIKKLTDNMLTINITTPIEKFKLVTGRFGINERDRHFVAEIRTPETALGAEILFQLVTSSDFDIKFNLETPLEAFEKIILIAKLKPKTIDFRGGWNKMLLGFVGIWRMQSPVDFEYSYKVFTPLHNFEDNGIVARYIQGAHDLEMSIKVAQYKLGILLLGQSKPKVINELGLQEPFKVYSDLFEDDFRKNNVYEDYEDDEDDDYEPININVYMELDVIVWPTIKGELRIAESDFTYICYGSLDLTVGIIELRDRFYFPDILTIKNEFIITTPFEKCKEVKSIYQSSIDIFKQYVVGIGVSFLSNNDWNEMGIFLNFTNTTDESDMKNKNIILNLKTPLENLPRLNIQVHYENDDNLYRCNFTGKTLFTSISVAGGLEYEPNYVDAQVGFSLATPLIPSYGVKVNFKRDFSLVENSVEFGYDREDNGIHKTIQMETVWQINQSKDYMTAKFTFDTNVIRLNSINSAIMLAKLPHPSVSLDLSYIIDSGEAEFLRIRGNRKKDLVTIDMLSPLNALQNVSISVSLNEELGPDSYSISGNVYRNSHIYGITGVATFTDEIPTQLNISIIPRDKSPSGTFYYALEDGSDGYSKLLTVKFKRSENFANLQSTFYFQNRLNWNYLMSLNTSEASLSKILIDTSVNQNKNVINGNYIIKTPWKHLDLDLITAQSSARIDYKNGRITSDYAISNTKHKAFSSWSLNPKDMHFIVSSVHDVEGTEPKIFEIDTKYMTKPNNITFGASININAVWIISAKGDLKKTETGESKAEIVLSIPKPAHEVHKITSTISGVDSTNFDNLNNLAVRLQYDSEIAKKHLALQTNYRDNGELFGLGRIEWGSDSRLEAVEANLLMSQKLTKRKFIANIATPWHSEDSAKIVGEFDVVDSYDTYKTVLNIPASKEVALVDISIKDLSNAKGMFNCSTPFLNITWFKADFDFYEKDGDTSKFVQGTWPENTALFNSKTVKRQINNKQKLVGDINIEIPIQSRHLININYDLIDEQNIKNGSANIKYNDKNVLNGKYGLVSKISQGTEKQEIDIELENDWKPIGVHYVHIHDLTRELVNIKDSKKVQLFELNNREQLNIAFEFFNTTSMTGQEFVLIAIHPNRTVILSGEYDYKDTKTIQKSKIQLAPDVWAAFDYNAQTTLTDQNELQIFSVQLSYPRRNLSAAGWYEIKPISFDSNIQFKWAKNPVDEFDYQEDDSASRVLSTTFKWANETQAPDESKHKFGLGLMHPSFEKNVTFEGTYFKDTENMFKTDFNIEYCDDSSHLLTFGLNIQDLSSHQLLYKNYTTRFYVFHEASELELDASGSIAVAPSRYEVYNVGKYKRGYIPLQEGLTLSKIDIETNEIHYYKSTPNQMTNYWTKVHESYPKYNISGLYEESPDTNINAEFLLDLDDKFIWLNVNLTPDATQQMQMIGMVPDARSAYFNIWRDYEDIHIDDVSYYLHMNHSRLVTSKLYWRPTIKLEIKNILKEQARLFYESLIEGLDFWKKTIHVEVVDSRNDIWNNAHPYMQRFIEDLSDIGGIQNDLDELRDFLNKSYTANDFYLKSLMNFTLTILDELALKDHIETVPKIVRELIQSMGESGQALKESIEILIEMIKSSYEKVITVIGKIFQGEMLESFSILIEQGVAKYDKWIKDLHISLIKYLENLYTKLTDMVVNSWKRILQNIEPTILRVAHYVETLIWKLSKEIFDFLYQRSNELVGSPYFNQVSNFTKDLDRFYRDIISNDAVTNIKKYSVVAWNFLQEKYFKLVPFGTELHNVLTEIYGEIKKLQTQEPFKFLIKKYNEISVKVQWVFVEFKIEQRAQQLFEVVKVKLSRLAQTALQADNQYREAKTKFLYNPNKGILELEQKLPMSWHAFNETPNFEEVSEYRLIHTAQEILAGSNETIWAFYHSLKPLVNPAMWFPPFKSQAFLLGSRNYITFDRKFVMVDFKYEILDHNSGKPNQCSYLLAKDYCDSNFTLLIEPSTMVSAQNEIISNRRYSLLVENKLVTVEILGDRVKVDSNETSMLPVRMKDLVIYREADILVMKSQTGFTFTCNMQFDYCTLELVGWYFGKTAGIFGTMNNEKFDDYLTSKNEIVSDYEEFTNSWRLPGCLNKPPINQYKTQIQQMPLELLQTCDSFFKNRGSYLATCFTTINPSEFYDVCLDLGMNSIANVLSVKHPSLRGACTTALAYIDVCNEAKIPLRIPDQCVHCQLVNGTFIPEGKFVAYKDDDLISSSDVVYIIEAKPCNENFATRKSMLAVASAIHNELNAANITNNRYAVVAFGGKPPFDEPRSIAFNSQVFTDDYRNLQYYFNHIQTGNGQNNDIFNAIIEAAKLIFRAGISKTFILVPCSQCLDEEMKLDYSSLLQLLLENGINLHILMNDDFVYDKARLTKKFLGIDRKFAFSKHDIKEFKGDPEIRKQIRLPKQTLGVCSPLALETNGSVFTASKLRPDKKNQYKKTSLVFSKRVALSARPQCQSCECTGHNTGIAYISCLPCEYPNAETLDSLESDTPSSDELEWGWNDSEELEM